MGGSAGNQTRPSVRLAKDEHEEQPKTSSGENLTYPVLVEFAPKEERGEIKNKKPEQGAAPALVLGIASGREGLHEVRAHRRLDHIVLEGDRGGQIRLHDFCNSRIHLALIALCIPLLRPESNGDGPLGGGLGTNGRISRKPGCFFRMGKTSLRTTLN